ncbi:MAG TPA: hypothetical protein DCL61_32300 [Cyanobacteria bacterium UBA12227]|nr:hypothetical protein [Cyanobacteria bacterium UBA12227]HAX87529.1 hypothetical protein [Cyanobacteria bacterium UBA11370]
METLAYLDLVLASEASASATPESLNLAEWLKLLKRSTHARIYWLSFVTILSIFGMAGEALAEIFRQGDSGVEVTEIQKRLQELNYFNRQPTGYFGQVTEDAVIRFQQDQGLAPDGIVGQSTKAALFNQTESRVRSESPVNRTVSLTTLPPPRPVGTLPPPRELGTLPPPPNFPGTSSRQEVTQTQSIKELRFGDRGSAVSQLQQKLREEGFDPGPVNGIYGVQTEEAVKQFQRANRLRVDGIAGSQTLAELGIIAKESEATGYVVVVPVRSGNTLTQVQQYVPTAISDDSRRGRFVNAGAFPNRASAESVSYLLRSHGLDARVAYWR